MRTATANGELFLLMAGAGFDGHVIGALDHGLKARIGKAAYVGPALRALARPLDSLEVAIDGRTCSATWVIVANARHYGGRFVLAAGGDIRRPGFVAVLFRATSRRRLAAVLAALAAGRLDRHARANPDEIAMQSCERVTIEARLPTPTQVDGDAFATTPLTVRRGGGILHLVVPD